MVAFGRLVVGVVGWRGELAKAAFRLCGCVSKHGPIIVITIALGRLTVDIIFTPVVLSGLNPWCNGCFSASRRPVESVRLKKKSYRWHSRIITEPLAGSPTTQLGRGESVARPVA